jgi:hypothetical protein
LPQRWLSCWPCLWGQHLFKLLSKRLGERLAKTAAAVVSYSIFFSSWNHHEAVEFSHAFISKFKVRDHPEATTMIH